MKFKYLYILYFITGCSFYSFKGSIPPHINSVYISPIENHTIESSASEVIKIQLIGLQKNNQGYKDSGIEQTWNFAHPDNKKNTGPLPNFKQMIKGRSYQMLINHISHTITEVGSSDKWAQFEVIILDQEKIYHKFNWQVEKYTKDGPLKDCWLTTMVSSPIPLGSSI